MAKKLIELSNITKTFDVGGHELLALDNVDFNLHGGEVLALTGPSGCGKSTLLNVIGLILEPNHGTVKLLGDNVTHLTEKQRSDIRRKQAGFIFQSFNLFPVLTAYENVAYPLILNNMPKQDYHDMVMDALDNVGLAEFAGQFPDNLSGGQRQRVAIARAVVHKPKIIIADEPTAALDSANTESVMSWLIKMAKENGSAIIMATHDGRVLKLCDDVVKMMDGRIDNV